LARTTKSNRYLDLLSACHTIQQLYAAAIYGARHSEVRHLKILGKLGSKHRASLGRKELRDAVDEVTAIEHVANSPTVKVELKTSEIGLLKKVVRKHLSTIRMIPLLARRQAVIALSATFEGFVADVIRQIYDANPLVLKSGKSTLKDGDLVDAVQSGDPLTLLKIHRLREVMYGSVADWLDYLRRPIGMSVKEDDTLTEMFLVRNAIVHNNSRVSQDLIASEGNRFKVFGRDLNVTEKDLERYVESVRKAACQIWEEGVCKFGV
jgi:hypothetical protein